MAKKKAAKELFVCVHCSNEFHVSVRWCARCEDHLSVAQWCGPNDTCDRCHSGANDRYLKRKKGRDERISKALAEIEAEHGPIGTGVQSKMMAAFEKWVASDEYRWRFEDPVSVPVLNAIRANMREEGYVGIGNVRSGSIAREVTVDLEENGAWPPDEVVAGVF